MGRAGMDFSLDKNLDEMMEYAINACSAVDSHHPWGISTYSCIDHMLVISKHYESSDEQDLNSDDYKLIEAFCLPSCTNLEFFH